MSRRTRIIVRWLQMWPGLAPGLQVPAWWFIGLSGIWLLFYRVARRPAPHIKANQLGR